MDLSIKQSSDFLHAQLSGTFSLKEAERTFLEILNAVEQHDASKVLVDGRGVTGPISTIERFYYGEFVARAAVESSMKRKRSSPKFSYVLHARVLDPNRLGETVALNRGVNVKAFDDVDDALQWLNS